MRASVRSRSEVAGDMNRYQPVELNEDVLLAAVLREDVVGQDSLLLTRHIGESATNGQCDMA